MTELLLFPGPWGCNKPALISPDGAAIDREELSMRVASTASYLFSQNISRPDRLALVMPPGPSLAVALLAAMQVTAVAPLSLSMPLPTLLEDLRRLGAIHLLVDASPPEVVLSAAAQLGLPLIPIDPLNVPVVNDGIHAISTPAPHDLALLLQTSGTTLRSKVVPLSYGNILASSRHIASPLELTSADCSLAAMPLFHIHCILASLLAPLLVGGSVICCRSSDPEILLDAIRNLAPTWLSAIPTLLQALLNASRQQLDSRHCHRLRFLRSSLSLLPPVLHQRLEEHFGVPVIEAYGMTEAAHQVCSNLLPGDGLTPMAAS